MLPPTVQERFKKDLPPCYKIYADLPGYQASVSPPRNIPPHITSALSRPDLVVVSTDSITLLELSVVINTEHHLLSARYRKEDRYGSLLIDLQQAGFSGNIVTNEVGCLGHFMPETVSKLAMYAIYRRILLVVFFSKQLVLQSPVHTGSLTPVLPLPGCS